MYALQAKERFLEDEQNALLVKEIVQSSQGFMQMQVPRQNQPSDMILILSILHDCGSFQAEQRFCKPGT